MFTAHAKATPFIAIAVTVLCWASAFPGIRAGLESYTPEHLALFRFIVASLALAAYAAASGMKWVQRSDLPRLLACGAIGITLYNLLLNIGELVISAGAASFIVNTVPIFTGLLGTLFLGERLRAVAWAGFATAMTGVGLIALSENSKSLFEVHALYVLAAACCQAVYFVVQKPLITKYGGLTVTTHAIWFGTLLLLPFSTGLTEQVTAASFHATASVIYLGLFPGAIAYVTFAAAMRYLPASRTAGFLFLVPIISMVIAWHWLGEEPSRLAILGGAIVLAGVALANRGKAISSPKSEEPAPQDPQAIGTR